MAPSSSALSHDVAGLAALLATSGLVHLVRPEVFEGIVPLMLPNRRALVYVSGVAEIPKAASEIPQPGPWDNPVRASGRS